MAKILLVEDDSNYRKSLKKVLVENGYEVIDVGDAIVGIEEFSSNKFDLVISDLLMEMMDGNRFLNFVKRMNSSIPTVILTGNSTPDAEMEALDSNVDKYLDKSVRIDVLLKYIDVLLSKFKKHEPVIELVQSKNEDIVIEMRGRRVLHNGNEVALTAKEFGILHMFLSDKGRAIQRKEFIDELWDNRFEEVEERVVDVHIKLLRKKLKISSIVSIRGYGYKWDE